MDISNLTNHVTDTVTSSTGSNWDKNNYANASDEELMDACKEFESQDTDYLYFHRSAYGPILGGNIRNHEGWKGKDYRPSLEGATLPVIAHEMGQWCAYPDFSVIDKFTGYLQPSNYRAFKASAERAQLLKYNSQFAHNSGKQQVRLYKEELEANLRCV